MISLEQYLGKYANHDDATADVKVEAEILLEKVNALMGEAFADGVDFKVNPATMSHVAGNGNGGFRPQDCAEGAPKSSHKQGRAVDVYDGGRADKQPFGRWCAANDGERLVKHGLYMEHPLSTQGKWTCWVHLTTREPTSGRRVFRP